MSAFSFAHSAYKASPSEPERKTTPLSIFEQMLQQGERDLHPPNLSEIPLINVEFLNYIAHQKGRTRICRGETSELVYIGDLYFPKLYTISPQEYLVEQLCMAGYNFTYSYFIYRFESPLPESQLKPRSQDDYSRGEGGYFMLKDGSNRLVEAQVSPGNLILLSFDRYKAGESRTDELEKYVRFTDYVINGKRIYDTSKHILSVFGLARGTADCGDFARCQLENRKFKLLEYQVQECCSSQQECQDPSYRDSPDEYPKIYP